MTSNHCPTQQHHRHIPHPCLDDKEILHRLDQELIEAYFRIQQLEDKEQQMTMRLERFHQLLLAEDKNNNGLVQHAVQATKKSEMEEFLLPQSRRKDAMRNLKEQWAQTNQSRNDIWMDMEVINRRIQILEERRRHHLELLRIKKHSVDSFC